MYCQCEEIMGKIFLFMVEVLLNIRIFFSNHKFIGRGNIIYSKTFCKMYNVIQLESTRLLSN